MHYTRESLYPHVDYLRIDASLVNLLLYQKPVDHCQSLLIHLSCSSDFLPTPFTIEQEATSCATFSSFQPSEISKHSNFFYFFNKKIAKFL